MARELPALHHCAELAGGDSENLGHLLRVKIVEVAGIGFFIILGWLVRVIGLAVGVFRTIVLALQDDWHVAVGLVVRIVVRAGDGVRDPRLVVGFAILILAFATAAFARARWLPPAAFAPGWSACVVLLLVVLAVVVGLRCRLVLGELKEQGILHLLVLQALARVPMLRWQS